MGCLEKRENQGKNFWGRKSQDWDSSRLLGGLNSGLQCSGKGVRGWGWDPGHLEKRENYVQGILVRETQWRRGGAGESHVQVLESKGELGDEVERRLKDGRIGES